MTADHGTGAVRNLQRHLGIVLAVAFLGLAACASAKDEPAKSAAPKAEKSAAPVADAPATAEISVAPAGDALAKTGAKQADTTDIVRMIAGRTIYGTGSTGRTFMIYFAPKGYMKMSAADGKFRDLGTWKVENSTLCYTWKNPKTGNDCEKVFVLPDGKVVYMTTEGKQGSFDAFGEGNLENL